VTQIIDVFSKVELNKLLKLFSMNQWLIVMEMNDEFTQKAPRISPWFLDLRMQNVEDSLSIKATLNELLRE